MIEFFDIATIPPTPWKNGGGTTRELACGWAEARATVGVGGEGGSDGSGGSPGGHAAATSFDWRVSVATVAADGPFSTFPGVDRQIMLLAGGGLRLTAEGGAFDHRLSTPWQPFAFPGEATVACSLLGGESTDFNVMARRNAVRADLRVVTRADRVNAARDGLLLALRGLWRVQHGTEPLTALPAGQGVRWSGQFAGWRVVPGSLDAVVAVVRIVERTKHA